MARSDITARRWGLHKERPCTIQLRGGGLRLPAKTAEMARDIVARAHPGLAELILDVEFYVTLKPGEVDIPALTIPRAAQSISKVLPGMEQLIAAGGFADDATLQPILGKCCRCGAWIVAEKGEQPAAYRSERRECGECRPGGQPTALPVASHLSPPLREGNPPPSGRPATGSRGVARKPVRKRKRRRA